MINATTEEIEEFNQGLSHLYWNKVLDAYMETHTLTCEDYEDMNRDQKLVIQELKKFFKRKKTCKPLDKSI